MGLITTLTNLTQAFTETKELAADAHLWASMDWASLNRRLNETQELARRAINNPENWSSLHWTTVITIPGIRSFTQYHKEFVTKMAFFQSFLSWETFLEESFICYLQGEDPPVGVPLSRVLYSLPTTRNAAELLIVPPGKRFPDWTVPAKVIQNASRFFVSGKPYDVLTSQQGTLQEIKTIRNAIAHSSVNARNEFGTLVRQKLGRYPPGLTEGRFLAMTIPGSSPPSSFLEFYISNLNYLAEKIIPN